MPEKKTTEETPKRRTRAKKVEPETPEPEPLLEDRRFVGALVLLAVVFLFGAGYVVGHAVGEGDATSAASPTPGGGAPADVHGFIGVVGRGVDGGALILDVIPGGPADRAGLRRGDIVVAMDGHDVPSMEVLASMVRGTEPGSTVELTVHRGDQTRTFEVGVVAQPELVERPGRIPVRPRG